MKKCFKCGEQKELSEFYKHSQMADGHLGKCKACAKKDVSENYDAKRDRYAEYERMRFQKQDRKANAVAYQRGYRARNPDKYLAKSMVQNALRDGRLSKLPCEVCGSQKSQAHHANYSLPLQVNWLCRTHHLELHGKQAY